MVRRGLLFAVIGIGLVVAPSSQIGAASVPGAAMLQATNPPPGPTIEITVVAPTAPFPAAPADPGTGLPSTVIIGLLVIVVIAVILGGMALVSRGRS